MGLLFATQKTEPLEFALRSGNSAIPEPIVNLNDEARGQTFVLWSKRLAPNLKRNFVPNANPPYYLLDEQTESVIELTISALTNWEGRPALTQGRIYGIFQNKPAELEQCYERIVRYIRRRWRKSPATWMGGYVGQAAHKWFEEGGLLLPNYIPPITNDWKSRLHDQHH